MTSSRALAGLVLALAFAVRGGAQQAKIVKQDYHIDGVDPGVRLFVRQKMAAGNTRFTDDNIVLFIHGATAPSTCDFDLGFKDYSWADWMVDKGYVVYMFDKRNYGFSSREKAMDEPAAGNKPCRAPTSSYATSAPWSTTSAPSTASRRSR